jgi:hypothetical protein
MWSGVVHAAFQVNVAIAILGNSLILKIHYALYLK